MKKTISLPIAITIIVACTVLTGLLAWQYGLIPQIGPSEPMPIMSKKEIPEEFIVPLELNLETIQLATILEEYKSVGFPVFSPDGKKVAYTASTKEFLMTFVVIGDEKGKEYVSVATPVFSPNSQKIAYVAQQGILSKGGKEFIVINNEEGKHYDRVLGYPHYIIFSPGSSRLAYIAEQDEKEFVVINGKEGKKYDSVYSPIIFSPDGKRIAYRTKRFIVVDSREGKKYEWVDTPLFSPDGQKLAYKSTDYKVNGEERESFIIINEKESEGYDSVGDFSFSPDSKKLVYSASRGENSLIVIENEEGFKEYNLGYSGSQFIFSPDGKKLVFEGRKDNKCFIVVGEEKNGKYEWKKTKEYRYVEGNPRGAFYDFCIGDIRISKNGQKIAYKVADADKGWFIVVQDKDGKIYYERKASALVSYPIVSPDGQTVAYKMPEGRKRFLVIGDRETKRYDNVTKLVFSSDSKYIAYGVKDGNELWWIVDEVE